MVDTNDGRMESDFATVIKLVREFFENADKNHDNKINREEFVGGAQDMPIILQLLQCDPGEGKLDYDPDLDPVNFDKLQISTAEEDKGQIKTSDDNTGTGTSSTDVSRSSAYQIN